jgi:N-acetylglucosamine kinase-like BadF-type ATPase
MSNASLVVAADGGNSKTDLVLATRAGERLACVSGPGTHPQDDGFAATAADLAELTRAALAAAGRPDGTPVAAGAYYLANVDLPEDEEAMRTALAQHALAKRLEVGNDTFAVLEAGSRRGSGIAVVSGAGINAAGQYPDGRRERFLGIGELSGDWGGASSLSVTGIGAAVRAVDGRGPSTALCDAVTAFFGADPESVAVAADRGVITRQQVLDFAPAVLAAATDGDAVAIGIAHRLADEVVSFVQALVHRMDLADSDVEVILGGGVLQARHAVLLDRIARGVHTVAARAQVHVLDVAPVEGALASAVRLAGATGRNRP